MGKSEVKAPATPEQIEKQIDDLLGILRKYIQGQRTFIEQQLRQMRTPINLKVEVPEDKVAHLSTDLRQFVIQCLIEEKYSDWKERVNIVLEIKLNTTNAAKDILDKYTRRSRS